MRKFPIEWVKEGDCIRCTSHALDAYGYPALHYRGVTTKICRLILMRRLRNLTSDVQCRHTCDNRWCINPAHIISGSLQDNMQDMVSRNRQARGERNGHAKLTDDAVREIRKSGETHGSLAKRFGVVRQVVSKAAAGLTWRHVR